MKITVQWTETHHYCEEVEVPDGLDIDEVDDWVNDNWRLEIWPNAIAEMTTEGDIEWSNP